MTSPLSRRVGMMLSFIDRLSRLGGVLALVSLVSLTVLVVLEILFRNLIGRSLDVTWEFSAYLMGASFLFGAAQTLREAGHIRVNVLLKTVPPAAVPVIELIATGIGLAIACLLTWSLGRLAWLSWLHGVTSIQPSELPLFIPQAALALGAGLFALEMAARMVRVVMRLPTEIKPANIDVESN